MRPLPGLALVLLMACCMVAANADYGPPSHPISAATALAASTSLRLVIVLKPRDEGAMYRMALAVSDPRSPAYHHFLSGAAWRARFGPDPAAVRALMHWLAGAGLQPEAWNGGTILDVHGDLPRIIAAFGSDRRSPHHRAGLAAWRVPTRFTATVRAVIGPSSEPVHRAFKATARAGAGTPTGYTAQQVTGVYDFQPLYTAGFHGEHLRVALVELAPFDPFDIGIYAAHFRLGTSVTTYPVDAGNAGETANVEATVDIELLMSIVPQAAIDVWNAPGDDSGTGLLDAYSDIASANADSVLGLTWVTCEPVAEHIAGFLPAEHALFAQMVAQGTTIVSAAGDGGAYGCSDPSQPAASTANARPAVSVPASDPYVLGVGATDLTLGLRPMPAIIHESAWSCPAFRRPLCGGPTTLGSGSGGGLSVVYTRKTDNLSWQVGPGVLNRLSTGGRQVPDVAASGSSGITTAHEYAIYYRHGWTVSGGTSAAMPIWAGLALLADQYLRTHGAPPLGWANPLVYQLGATRQPLSPYHDITTGDNLLYTAAPGWDFASGWGSPDAFNFVQDVAAIKLGTTITPTATFAPTPVPVSSLTSTPSPTLTPTRPASPSPSPTAIPGCPTSGLGNGSFASGTLVCWNASGDPVPRIEVNTLRPHRAIVRLGSAAPGQSRSSVLSQTFTLPSTLLHPYLYLDYWLRRSVPSCPRTCASSHTPNLPVLAVVAPAAHYRTSLRLSPHRDQAWSGVKMQVPAHGRATLTITVPAQPPGLFVLLYLDSVEIGP